MIYTSYFAQLRNIPENIIPISICVKAPSWYTGKQYKKLAPKYQFFMEWKKNHDNDYYIEHYKSEVLDNLDILTVLRDLLDLTQKDTRIADIALICYEKPNEFCHRHLVAEWLKEHGLQCKEWTYEGYRK